MKFYKNSNISAVALVVGLLITLLFGFVEIAAQPEKRKATVASSASSPVVSRSIKAMQERDFKTIVALTYTYQVELQAIRQQHPRALWVKKTQEFYDSKVATLTQEASFWGNYGLGFGTLTGDPAENFRSIASFLPEMSTWKISETRKETVNSMIQGSFAQTAVYVTVSYSLTAGKPLPPVLSNQFLKSTMLKFGVRGNHIENVYHVGEMNAFWSPPYPRSAMEFLADKVKSDFLRGIVGSMAELESLIGSKELEVYLLQVAENPPENRVVFTWALEYLTVRRNKKAVPIIHRALEANTDYSQDSDLVYIKALKEIGPSDYPSVDLVKKRLGIKLRRLDRGKDVQTLDDPAVWWHLDVLASLDNNPAWKTFPPNLLRRIVDELDEKQIGASVMSSESKQEAVRFFSGFRPCEKGFLGQPRCFFDLGYTKVTVVDPWTMTIDGPINERAELGKQSKPTGRFEIDVFRTPNQPTKWMVKSIRRTGSTAPPNAQTSTSTGGSDWLNGTWTGSAYQANSRTTWTVRLEVANGTLKVTYPSLSCGGLWIAKTFGSGTGTFLENITYGTDKCEQGVSVVVRKVNDSKISVEYSSPTGTDKTTLTRAR